MTHPAFAPYRRWLDRDPSPSLSVLNDWAREAGIGVTFVAATPMPAIDYERSVADRGEVPTREGDRHDLCNALAWLAFPRTKAALNAIHVRDAAGAAPNARSRARDAATLLDESGLLVACANPSVLAGWRAHAWRETFWTGRDVVARDVTVHAIGHGLLQRLDAPHRALTAKALVLALPATTALPEVDAAATAVIAAGIAPRDLLPLPVAALPGWDGESLGAALFDDASVFRPSRATLDRGGNP